MSGDFSLCGSRRHRYADVLQWADDTSALLGVDDPALSDRLKRRQSRAVSALQRTLATSRQGPGAQGTKAVRPNSAPPGFDPVPVGSALQVWPALGTRHQAVQRAIARFRQPTTALGIPNADWSSISDCYHSVLV